MRSTPPEPAPDTIWRSPDSVAFATFQPAPTSPTRWASGTRAPSRNTSLKSTSPPMWRKRLDVDAGLVQIEQEVREPVALRARRRRCGRARRAKSARCAHVVHTFWPVITQVSPSRTARVASDARSEPAPGSLKSWHHILLVAHDRRQETQPLLLGAEREQRRRGQVQTRGG